MSTFFGKLTNLSSALGMTSADDAGKSDRAPKAVSLPLYIAGAIAQIAGLVAVSYQIGEPVFAYFTIGLTVLGAAAAVQMRRMGTPPRLMQIGVLLLGLIFLYALRGAGVFGAIVPPESQGTQEILLTSALAFTATFSTFFWLNDEAVAFSCVWSIAMIGLTGTVNINRELIICFIVFLAAATFLLVHQNTLAQSSGRASATLEDLLEGNRGINWDLLRTQAMMAALAWVGSILLGFLLAIPLQMAGRNFSLNTIIQRLKVPPTQSRRVASRPRLVFDSLSTFNVGVGPVDDDPSERAQVLTDAPRYWRSRTFDQYTGRGWVSSLANQGADVFPTEGQETSDGLNTFDLQPIENHPAKSHRVTHRFRIVGGIYGPLFHAAEPRRLRAPIFRVVQRDDNTLNSNRGLDQVYEVESDVVEPQPGELRTSGTRYPVDIRDRYLNTGPLNETVRVLLDEALNGVNANPYDRAQAIRRFIANRCIYTREAQAVPRDRDATDFFLNESREGYCDLYATALTVLCRYAGIPARIATGFAPGTPASPDDDVPPIPTGDKREWYILRGSDLHAWTEVYFAGHGWVALDATQDTPGVETPERTPEPVKKKKGFWDYWKKNAVWLSLIGLSIVGFLYVIANELMSRIRLPGFRLSRARGSRSRVLSHEILRTYLKTTRQIARRGAKRSDTMTPSEYLRYVREQVSVPVADALTPLTLLTERALYGPDDLGDAETAQAHQAAQAVNDALRNYRKPVTKEATHGT